MMQKEYAYIADRLFRAKRLQIYAPIIADQNIKRSYSVLQILTAGAIETYKNTKKNKRNLGRWSERKRMLSDKWSRTQPDQKNHKSGRRFLPELEDGKKGEVVKASPLLVLSLLR